jgi:hypothetical protein
MATAFPDDDVRQQWILQIIARVGIAHWTIDLSHDALQLLGHDVDQEGKLPSAQLQWIMHALRRKALLLWKYGGGVLQLTAGDLEDARTAGSIDAKGLVGPSWFEITEFRWALANTTLNEADTARAMLVPAQRRHVKFRSGEETAL